MYRLVATTFIKPARAIGRRNFIIVVDQATVAYREFLGGNPTRLEPGLRLNLPILHETRVINMRECGLNIASLHAYTSDNVPVMASGTLFYRVFDAEKACYSVENVNAAIHAIGQSTIRAGIGRFAYDDIIADRIKLNASLIHDIGDGIRTWGVNCTRFEIQEFGPQNASVAKHLEKQLTAERERRENEQNVLAKIRSAEGEKRAAVLQSEGERIAAENRADAEKYAIQAMTEAYKQQLVEMTAALGDSSLAAKYMVDLLTVKNLGHIAQGDNRVYFMPTDSVLPTARTVMDMLQEAKK
ncbi:hypothetical protein DYB32_007741 [Aphanomyces invadans]|uniref:Band 7 domain-containing protein n=1 Tax=Aphanomyces invadans TaxID=157072 RepID=A0A3R7CWF2_9STRA|nr:hypothetical protein DYB32_007741 [Aphanomyces invadans]